MTHSRRVVLVFIGLAAMIIMGSPNQGKIFYGINSPFIQKYTLCHVSVSVHEIYG